ncbi:MAG: hypothetical protein VKK97_10430 [Synechococcaceae cyanobacterium]|nr:hypothetical protein [Synechococcaceae cyanobacterium]
MKAAEIRKLIGKSVKYRNLKGWCPERWHEGIVEEVAYKNVCIQGDWLWLPDLIVREVKQ